MGVAPSPRARHTLVCTKSFGTGGGEIKAKTVDDVLTMLAAIVADTKKRRDPLGFFPALYRQVTLRVKDGIEQGVFDDGPRMTKFDAAFANAYFTAYDHYRKHQRTSRVWQAAFDSAASGRPIILQNLLLAINAHINLDLGVVAGTAFPPSKLDDFHADFDRINDILASLIPLARSAVEDFSPLLAELTAVGGPDVALALEFSVDVARDEAWRTATIVSLIPAELRPLVLTAVDSKAKLVGRVISDPPEPVGTVVRRIHRAESTNVVAIITALDNLV
jgi:hypothetical protein